MYPKVSIVVPSFNQKNFLRSAIYSLEIQECQNLEVIVVDGGSTDGTVELLQNSETIVSKWVSEKDNGQTDALNKGFRLAEGEIFGWLNCDEQYLPGTLKTAAEEFAQEKDLDILFGNRIVIDEAGKEICRQKQVPLHPFKYALYAGGLLFSDAAFWSASLHRKTGELDTEICGRYGMDYEWFFRMSLYVKKWKYVDQYFSLFTEHPKRISVNVEEMPAVADSVRKKIHRLAGINKADILLKSPFYLAYTRFYKFGWKGLVHIPSIKSVPRIAGIVK